MPRSRVVALVLAAVVAAGGVSLFLYSREEPPGTHQRETPDYEIVAEDVQDSPRANEVTTRFVVHRAATHDNIRASLGQVFAGLTRTKRFQWHDPPTTVRIYAYHSKEAALESQDDWIAAIEYGPYDQCHPENRRGGEKPSPKVRFK